MREKRTLKRRGKQGRVREGKGWVLRITGGGGLDGYVFTNVAHKTAWMAQRFVVENPGRYRATFEHVRRCRACGMRRPLTKRDCTGCY